MLKGKESIPIILMSLSSVAMRNSKGDSDQKKLQKEWMYNNLPENDNGQQRNSNDMRTQSVSRARFNWSWWCWYFIRSTADTHNHEQPPTTTSILLTASSSPWSPVHSQLRYWVSSHNGLWRAPEIRRCTYTKVGQDDRQMIAALAYPPPLSTSWCWLIKCMEKNAISWIRLLPCSVTGWTVSGVY